MELVTGPKGRTYLKGTAPCGCVFNGRFYSTTACTALPANRGEVTGSQITRHMASVDRAQKRILASA